MIQKLLVITLLCFIINCFVFSMDRKASQDDVYKILVKDYSQPQLPNFNECFTLCEDFDLFHNSTSLGSRLYTLIIEDEKEKIFLAGKKRKTSIVILRCLELLLYNSVIFGKDSHHVTAKEKEQIVAAIRNEGLSISPFLQKPIIEPKDLNFEQKVQYRADYAVKNCEAYLWQNKNYMITGFLLSRLISKGLYSSAQLIPQCNDFPQATTIGIIIINTLMSSFLNDYKNKIVSKLIIPDFKHPEYVLSIVRNLHSIEFKCPLTLQDDSYHQLAHLVYVAERIGDKNNCVIEVGKVKTLTVNESKKIVHPYGAFSRLSTIFMTPVFVLPLLYKIGYAKMILPMLCTMTVVRSLIPTNYFPFF